MKKSLIIFILSLTAYYVPAYADRAGGGGNTVGDQLFDDYENTGSAVIPSTEIAAFAAPVLTELDQKVPGFAAKLREGIKGIIWYREPKPLNQSGLCKDGSETGMSPPIDQVVRACQNRLDVRIEMAWYDSNKTANPKMVSGLIVHELLVYQGIRTSSVGEEAVLMISRDIRSSDTSAEKIKADLKTSGFGAYPTHDDLQAAASAHVKGVYENANKSFDTACRISAELVASYGTNRPDDTLLANVKAQQDQDSRSLVFFDLQMSLERIQNNRTIFSDSWDELTGMNNAQSKKYLALLLDKEKNNRNCF